MGSLAANVADGAGSLAASLAANLADATSSTSRTDAWLKETVDDTYSDSDNETEESLLSDQVSWIYISLDHLALAIHFLILHVMLIFALNCNLYFYITNLSRRAETCMMYVPFVNKPLLHPKNDSQI